MHKTQLVPIIWLNTDDAHSLISFLQKKGIEAFASPADGFDGKVVSISVKHHDVENTTAIFSRFGSKLKELETANVMLDGEILIPVDLTAKSFPACKVGFELAERLNLNARLLHSYTVPRVELNLVDVIGQEEEPLSATTALTKASAELDNFARKLKELQSKNHFADINFKSDLLPGVPEECILVKAKARQPKMIVMSTRTRHKKAEELIGSVTAEVLDSCRVPLFTVPEDYECPGIRNIKRLVFFCHGDKHDQNVMKQFLSLFGFPSVQVTLLPVSDRLSKKSTEYVSYLSDTFNRQYPTSTFEPLVLNIETFREDFKNFLEVNNIELLIVQNKKKNIFSRLLNPGIAHILLYERDMPMIILPV